MENTHKILTIVIIKNTSVLFRTMQVFSKPVLESYYDTMSKCVSPITYTSYQKNPHCLFSRNVSELKACIRTLSTKSYRIHMNGKKKDLMDRIVDFFTKTSKAVKIQACFRGFLYKRTYALRGPARSNVRLCVNETDFYTLDPLNEMDPRHFFSYRDEKGFVYGFDIFSLVNLFKREHRIVNPYNRETVSISVLSQIVSLFQKVVILFPEAKNGKTLQIPSMAAPPARMDNRHRIRAIFLSMDELGNYTNMEWFQSMDKLQYARFYEYYYIWWNRGFGLSEETKRQICAAANPFSDIRTRSFYELTREDYQTACLDLMEHMVYTGRDTDSKRLGTLHVLSMLTLVSEMAREAMPWLYDSIRETSRLYI